MMILNGFYISYVSWFCQICLASKVQKLILIHDDHQHTPVIYRWFRWFLQLFTLYVSFPFKEWNLGGIAHLKICKTHRHLPCMTFSHFPVNIQRRNTLKRPNSIKFDDFPYFPQGNMREIFQHLMFFLVFPMVFPHFPMVFPWKTPYDFPSTGAPDAPSFCFRWSAPRTAAPDSWDSAWRRRWIFQRGWAFSHNHLVGGLEHEYIYIYICMYVMYVCM